MYQSPCSEIDRVRIFVLVDLVRPSGWGIDPVHEKYLVASHDPENSGSASDERAFGSELVSDWDDYGVEKRYNC